MGKNVRKAVRKMDRVNGKFSRHITSFIIPKTHLASGRAVAATSLELMALVVKAWPVAEENGGTSRAAWNVSLEGLGGTGTKAGAAEEAAGRAKGKLFKKLLGSKPLVRMTNGVDYAIFLEAGHSKQAPKGVLRQAFRFIMTGHVANREFAAKWRGIR